MMKVAVFNTPDEAASATAGIVAAAVRSTRRIVLGLPTGRTMEPMYKALIDHQRHRPFELRSATTFNLDEFEGLETNSPGSYRAFMQRHLFDRIRGGRPAAHFPSAAGCSPEEYDDVIDACGGLDLCVIGIGRNGHIGFNEPGGTLVARTHRVRLLPSTRRANAHLFGGQVTRVPTHAISMGMGTILSARAVVLLATGREKAGVVRRGLQGPITTRIPASLLQCHPHSTVILDRAAAAALGRRRP